MFLDELREWRHRQREFFKMSRLYLTATLLVLVLLGTFMLPSLSEIKIPLAEASMLDFSGEIASKQIYDEKNELADVEADNYKNTWDAEQVEADVLHEAEHLRTANEKHFRMSDGSYSLISYANDVHYLKDDKYVEIDNTLEKYGDVYKNKSNILQVELPQAYTKNSKTSVSVGRYSLSFKMLDYVAGSDSKASTATVENKIEKQSVTSKNNFEYELKNQSSARYLFAESNVELEQFLIGTQFKENIVVKSRLSSYKFSFVIEAKGLQLELSENGDIYAYSNSGEHILSIPKGYMFDAAGEYSEAVDYSLSESQNGYVLTVNANSDWMNSKKRVFPVTIDPTVEVASSSGAIRTATRGTANGNWLPVSKDTKSFLAFDVPEKLANATVIAATLRITAIETNASILNAWECPTDFEAGSAPELNVTEGVTDPKDPNKTISVYSYYFDDDSKGYLPEQQVIVPEINTKTSPEISLETRYVYIDITRNLKRAVDFGSSDFCAFAFSGSAGSDMIFATENYSDAAWRPVVEIQYRSIVGLENYWDYDQYNVGGDTVYVNKYNDALTIVHEDVSIASELPINLQHVYMSAYESSTFNVDGIFNGVDFGLGWKLNYQQIIRCRGNDFEYYDADGTMHYFKAKSGYAEDEDGLGLKIYNEAGYFKMTDKAKNEWLFDSHGRLYKISDRNGNMINILYGNGSQGSVAGLPITEINDNNGKQITFTYSSGRLTAINYKMANGDTPATTNIQYDSSGRISRITNSDGTYTQYGYSNYRLRQLTDESGYSISMNTSSTLALDSDVSFSLPEALLPWVKTRSVYESSGGNEWLHVQDNIYCNGLTLSVSALGEAEYIPYQTRGDYDALISAWTSQYTEGMNWLQILIISVYLGLYAHLSNIDPFIESCMNYYESNFRIKSVYDNCGRLVSSYIDDTSSLTAAETLYGETGSGASNKPIATAEYTPGVVNLVKNGSFEDGLSGWTEFNSGGTPYQNRAISTKYATQGTKSMEMFVSQPVNGVYEVSQYLTVPAGTYTLSANIRVENLLIPYSSTVEYGVFIRMGLYARSEYITADIYSVNKSFAPVSVTYTFTQPTTFWVDCVVQNCAGFVYFDEIQLVRNDYGTVDVYNNAVNAGFESWSGSLPTGWEYWTNTSQSAGSAINQTNDVFSGKGIKINGTLDGAINLYQRVAIPASSQSAAYTVSVWTNNKGRSYFPYTASTIALHYRLYDKNMNPLTNFITTKINSPFAVWQQISATFVAPPQTRFVEINIQLNLTTSVVYFDNVSLVQSQIMNYEYNNNGTMSSYSDGQASYGYEESGNRVALSKDDNDIFGVQKDANGNVISSSDFQRSVKMQYTYDAIGRIKSETFSSLDGVKKIESLTTYQMIEDEPILSITDTDSLGFKTISNYYSYSGLLDKTTFNDGTYVEQVYSYDTIGNCEGLATITIKRKTSGGSSLSTYIYKYFTMADALTDQSYGNRHVGMLKSVTLENGTEYSYVYDKWGNVTTVRLNGIDQIIYEYRQSDGASIRKTVGGSSGFCEYYYYNVLGRLIEVRSTESAVYSHEYVRSLPDSSLKAHIYYEYSVGGNLVLVRDTINQKGYWHNYDTNGRTVLSGEGEYIADQNILTTKTLYETVYDLYGDVNSTNIIDLTGEQTTFGVSVSATAHSGALVRTPSTLYDTISVGGVEKIRYTHNYSGIITQEQNSFLGKTFNYARNSAGKIVAVNVDNTTYLPHFSIKSSSYEYDNGAINAWDSDWAIGNSNSGSGVSKIADQQNDDDTITDVVRVNQSAYWAGGSIGYRSLVDPTDLMLGVVELRYSARLETANSNLQVFGLVFQYTDGTYSPDSRINGTDWQEFHVVSDPEKTVSKIALWYYHSAWLYLGNIQVTVRANEEANAWSNEWALGNHNSPAGISTVVPIAHDIANSVYNIIQVHPGNFWDNTAGHISLMNPEVLKLGGDNVKLTYSVRRINPQATNTQVGGLRFRYSDGTASAYPLIELNSNWQTFSLTSPVGKTVVAIELGWNYGETLYLGNVILCMQGAGRADGRTSGENLFNGNYAGYTYDELGRLENSQIKSTKGGTSLLGESYTYVDGVEDNLGNNLENNTSYTVSGVDISYGGTSLVSYEHIYNMDASGTRNLFASNPYNIHKVVENGVTKTEYYYNQLGQLVRENNAYTNQTVTWAYDTNNNITGKTVYGLSWGSSELQNGTAVSYVYGATNFADRLTAYNGQSIIYDNNIFGGLGLPTTYLGMSLEWAGRELSQVGIGTSTYNYTYDAFGMRLSKSDGTTTTEYLYSGGQLLRETDGTDTIWYIYDQNGLLGFALNGTTYYYVRNLQGDVTKIIGTNGAVLAQYVYDAWGVCTIVTDTNGIGAKNPIRYRGYYQDSETGFYYLQSRYYDPAVGRFISPDVLAEDGSLYAYCVNDPVNRVDENGYLSAKWKKALKIIAVAATVVAVVAVTVATCGAGTAVLAGTAATVSVGVGVASGTALTVAAVATVTAVTATATLAADKILESAPKNHTVYQLKDNNDQVVYVGRTKNVEARQKAHEQKYPDTRFEVIASGLNYAEARGLEQIAMLEYNTKAFFNKINGISPNNRNLKLYMAAGAQFAHYIGNQISNEILNWSGK